MFIKSICFEWFIVWFINIFVWNHFALFRIYTLGNISLDFYTFFVEIQIASFNIFFVLNINWIDIIEIKFILFIFMCISNLRRSLIFLSFIHNLWVAQKFNFWPSCRNVSKYNFFLSNYIFSSSTILHVYFFLYIIIFVFKNQTLSKIHWFFFRKKNGW